MSALGQKQTFALQNVMSALPPIATSIAFFGVSALGQSGHFSLFDYLVGGQKQAGRYRFAERLRGREIDNGFELDRRLYPKIGRLVAAQDTVDVRRQRLRMGTGLA
jgi:hypothetical protein